LQAADFWLGAPIELRVDQVKVWQLSIANFTLRESAAGHREQQHAGYQRPSAV
jgi:hypothetical protein